MVALSLAVLLAAPALRAAEEAKAVPLTLTKAMEQVEALRAKVTLDLEGANLNNAVEWLEAAGISVVLPAALKPREGDNSPTLVVKVKDLPVGLVVDQFLTAGEYKYDVKIAQVDGKNVCLVAICLDAQGGGLFRMFQQRMGGGPGPFPANGAGPMGMQNRRPGGGPGGMPGRGGPQGGGRGRPQGGGNGNNPNQQAQPDEPF